MSEKELAVLKEAIINENEGYEFYRMAAEKAENKEAKEAFHQLAEEELKHKNWLKDMYVKIQKGKSEDFDLEEISVPESPHVFEWENASPAGCSLPVSVYGIGVKMEKESIDYYKRAAKKAEVPEAKVLYESLVKWESRHLEDFQEQYEELKNNWWREQRFEPF